MPGLGYGTMLKPNPYNGRILPVPFSPYVTLSEWSNINSLYAYKEKKPFVNYMKSRQNRIR